MIELPLQLLTGSITPDVFTLKILVRHFEVSSLHHEIRFLNLVCFPI